LHLPRQPKALNPMKPSPLLRLLFIAVLMTAFVNSSIAQDRSSHDPRQAERGKNFEKNRFVVP